MRNEDLSTGKGSSFLNGSPFPFLSTFGGMSEDRQNEEQSRNFAPLKYRPDGQGSFKAEAQEEDEAVDIAMQQAWEEVEERVDRARDSVKAGKASPIRFYMELNMMDEKLLGQYLGIPRRKVRKHLKPRRFAQLDGPTLNAYAELFGIGTEELRNPDLSKTASPYRSP